jgi:membrane protein
VKTSLSGPRLLATLKSWPWLATMRMLAHRFGDERLALTAGGLTFATIISLVPLVTVMLALFSAFPMFATMEEAVQRYFLQALVPDAIARPVPNAINQFSNRASRLGVVGLVALVISAIAMMLTIDRALNAVWRVRRPRPIAQRVLVYWAAFALGPICAGASLAVTA